MSTRLRTAVIGYGYWGKNITRVIQSSADFELRYVCELSQKNRSSAKAAYPHALCLESDKELPMDEIDVVAIITPTDSHYPLAKKYLSAGKHVLVTKPFTRTHKEATELVELARQNGVCIFVDHTFVFNPAVNKLKEMLPRIGQPYFVLSQRLNLGLFQPEGLSIA